MKGAMVSVVEAIILWSNYWSCWNQIVLSEFGINVNVVEAEVGEKMVWGAQEVVPSTKPRRLQPKSKELNCAPQDG